MVVHLLGSFAGLAKSRVSHTKVDNNVFRLHYRWTASLLFISAALVSATEYFGNPIYCLSGSSSSSKAATTYCWIAGSFSLVTKNASNLIVPYYGLGNENIERHGTEQRFHAYYQWVPAMLFIQGCLFYLPHLLWKMVEGRSVDALLQGLNVITLDNNEKKIANIVKHLVATRGMNVIYAYVFFGFEVLNLLNVVVQMFMLDDFFGGAFLTFGSEVMAAQYEQDINRRDPLIARFPRMTKCTFRKFGSSGSIEHLDNICMLPQNILNEKIFLIFWFWFIILMVITIIQIVLRIVSFVSPRAREIKFEFEGKFSDPQKLRHLINGLPQGDFALLNVMKYNLDALTFKTLLDSLINEPNYISATVPSASAPILFNGDTTLPSYRTLNDNIKYPVADTLELKNRNLFK